MMMRTCVQVIIPAKQQVTNTYEKYSYSHRRQM
jgi:hypothetical protein